jgi:hypothetical protein
VSTVSPHSIVIIISLAGSRVVEDLSCISPFLANDSVVIVVTVSFKLTFTLPSQLSQLLFSGLQLPLSGAEFLLAPVEVVFNDAIALVAFGAVALAVNLITVVKFFVFVRMLMKNRLTSGIGTTQRNKVALTGPWESVVVEDLMVFWDRSSLSSYQSRMRTFITNLKWPFIIHGS